MRLFSERVLIDTDGGPTIASALVETRGSRVHSVTTGSREALVGRGVVDFGERLVTPAFVNGHTHIAMGAYRGIGGRLAQSGNVVEELYFKLESAASDDDFRAFARMGAWDTALSGTGAIIDQYYAGLHIAEAMRDVGLTGIVAPTLQDIAGPGKDGWAQALEVTETLATSAEWQAAEIHAAVGPHATDTVSDNLWGRALDIAKRLDLPVHVHVGQSLEEVERSWSEHQCSPTQRVARQGAFESDVRMLLVHMLYVSDADLAFLHPERHLLGYCPRSQAQFAYPASLDSWREAGLDFVLGTDAAVCNDTMNVQQELRWLAGGGTFSVPHSAAHAALRTDGDLQRARQVERTRRDRFERDAALNDPHTLLKTVGTNAARLHPRFDVGRIAPGAIANLCVWDLDHPALWPATDPLRALCFADAGPALHAMVLRGEWFGAPGYMVQSITQSDVYKEHRAEADERLEALLGRL